MPKHSLFDGPGEVRALCRAVDWSETALGPVTTWSSALRLAVRLCLECKSAMALWVGPRFTLIHNDAYSPVLGTKYPAALGHPLRELWGQLEGEFNRVLLQGESLRHEEASDRLPREGQEPEGSFAFSLTPLRDVDGRVIGVFNVMEETTSFARARIERDRKARGLFEPLVVDVTERQRGEEALRESEARLRRLWEAGMVGVFMFEIPTGSITDGNDKVLDLVGYTRDDLRQGHVSWAQMTPEEYRALDAHAVDELHTTGVCAPYEKEFIRKDGARVSILVGAATFDSDKSRGIAFVLDISKPKELERALRQANQQLVEADLRKNSFIAMLSHELRNPLAPIKNSLFILDRAAPTGDQARRARDVIKRQIDQLSHLVDDLLDVTRITRGKIQLHRCRLDLNELVRRTIDDHRALFQAAEVRLELAWSADPVFVDADWNRTAQVVSNLLQNSAKFTRAGGRVMVSVTPEPGASQAVFRIVDTGIGMKPELQTRLFQPFMQADETLDRSSGGLGLGLALVKGLVEQHGGSVEARSEGLERGSEFVVRLPLLPSAPASVAQAAAPAPGPRHRVLIIEDNVDAAESLKEVLELQGHDVAVAHDGPAGLARAREARPDLVLCDIGLPGMDGYAVARAFRADAALRGVHLIALSGYALPQDLRTAAEAGFERHLAKPPSLEKLESLLGQLSAA